MTTYQDHYRHSLLVRHWRPKDKVLDPFGTDWQENEGYALRSPFEGYLVQVSFAPYKDHPEYVRVRSTNWRCEHEPGGIYTVADARRFYKDLRAAGFVKVES